jgi:hypothetical protein
VIVGATAAIPLANVTCVVVDQPILGTAGTS